MVKMTLFEFGKVKSYKTTLVRNDFLETTIFSRWDKLDKDNGRSNIDEFSFNFSNQTSKLFSKIAYCYTTMIASDYWSNCLIDEIVFQK